MAVILRLTQTAVKTDIQDNQFHTLPLTKSYRGLNAKLL